MNELMGSVWTVLVWSNGLVLAYLVIQNSVHLAQIALAFLEVTRHRRQTARMDPWWLLTSEVALPISILVPAHNEAATIVENIHSMLSLHYPEFEVIVVNDGSSDDTMEVVLRELGLKPINRIWHEEVPHAEVRGVYGSEEYPRLVVVDKVNGGKADALNAGINVSRFPLFCAVDADSLLDHDSLLQAMRPFIEEPEEMIAAGGRLSVVNGCKVRAGQVVEYGLPRHVFPLLQSIEYIRAFLIARLAWSRLNAMLIISGAFGLFKRSAAVKVGGYSHDTVGEDMEIVVKLHRHHIEGNIPYQMRFVPDSICWTQTPESYGVLARQRTRWQRGLLQTVWKHRSMVFNPSYGRVGVVGMGYFFLTDVVGPIIEFLGYFVVPLTWLTDRVSTEFFLAYVALTVTYGVFISTASLLIEMLVSRTVRARDIAMMTLCAIVENFGYRQWNNWWRVEGFYHFLAGRKEWGKMTRQQFQKSEPKN